MIPSPVGLIGVGLLGTALAERMLAAGSPVIGFDLRPAQLERLRQLGGTAAETASQLPSLVSTIVLCLPDSHAVAALVEEIESSLPPGALLIDATTGDPDQTAAIGQRLSNLGIGYIDATLAGSSEQVRRGEGVVIVGGDVANVQRAEPILVSWSPRRRFHVGPIGSGARLKLVVNLVLGLNRAVLAEGLSLAQACGIEPLAALEVLKATPAYSMAMDTKGVKMATRDYSVQARLAQHKKDVHLIRELGQRHQAQVPLSAIHEELLARAIELGYGDADNSAIIEAFLDNRSANP